MKSVRITGTYWELDDVRGFLNYYCAMNTPAMVRSRSTAHTKQWSVDRLVPTLCALLLLRLTKVTLERKEKYKVSIPSGEALALLHAWSTHGNAKVTMTYALPREASSIWNDAHSIIGNLHQQLA